MNLKPYPELIDEENPEWTDEIFAQAKPMNEVDPELVAMSKWDIVGIAKGEDMDVARRHDEYLYGTKCIDFPKFLDFQPSKYLKNQNETKEQIDRDNARWDALIDFATDESQRLLDKMADEALAEIELLKVARKKVESQTNPLRGIWKEHKESEDVYAYIDQLRNDKL